MKKNLIKCGLTGLLAGMLALGCTACSTSAVTNANSYFSSVSKIVDNLTSANKAPSASESKGGEQSSAATPLDGVTNFTVDADGNYSFTGCEGAGFYLIYFCDVAATDDEDDYIYASSPIEEDGSGNCSGNCADLFDFSYGQYLVKAFAFPELTDTTRERSTAAMQEYTVVGAQDSPVIDYFWDTNEQLLEIVLTNIDAYTYQAYPDSVDVTFSNVSNSADNVTVSLTDINADHYSVTTDQLKKDQTYTVTAVSNSASEYVTNAVSDAVNVVDELYLGEINVLSDNYTFSDGWATFPRLVECADLNGGQAGEVSGKFGGIYAPVETTAISANAGSAHSYTIKIDFGGFAMDGTLELKLDGTAEMTENGGGPVSAGTVFGSWVDNGDGTATISYSPSGITS
jgi:hypothetical protein